MPGLPPAGGSLVLVDDEVALARAAHRAEPGVGDVLEGRPRGDSAIGVALLGIVDVAAGLADPALEGLCCAHALGVSVALLMRRRLPPGRVSGCAQTGRASCRGRRGSTTPARPRALARRPR